MFSRRDLARIITYLVIRQFLAPFGDFSHINVFIPHKPQLYVRSLRLWYTRNFAYKIQSFYIKRFKLFPKIFGQKKDVSI